MLKKSSLGRRSSVLSQGRLSFSDKNSSRLGDGRKSLIPKPCFGSKSGRSSSADRDLNMSSMKKDFPMSGLRRSKSQVSIDLGRTSTPCYTPIQYNVRNTGSVYKTQMSERSARSNSVGGLKSAKKESRPVMEKTFQLASQQKIQEFFLMRAPDLLDKGSIKPMTTRMFADLVNFLISRYDRSIQINGNNLIDGVFLICKLFNYRGKAEKSWLCTVNTLHSWPHVVSFLSWLVDLYLVSEIFNVPETLYPEGEGDADINDYDFKLLVPHLHKGYNLMHKQKPPGDHSEEMRLFLEKHKNALNVCENEIDQLQQEYSQLQNEVNNLEDTAEEEKHQNLIHHCEVLKRDIRDTKEYNYNCECYVATINEKLKAKDTVFEEYGKRIEDLKVTKEHLQALITSQEMTPQQKTEIETKMGELQRLIQLQNELINEYKSEIFKEDLKMVGVKMSLNKMIQAYNKDIVVHLASMPELKKLQIEENTLLYQGIFAQVDEDLKEIKIHLKTMKQDVEMEVDQIKACHVELEDGKLILLDKYEYLRNECSRLETEIADLKKIIHNDEKEMRKTLAEVEESIKKEKDLSKSELCSEEIELVNLKNKKNDFEKRYQEYVEKTSTSLKNRVRNMNETRIKLKEITKQKLQERKEILRKVWNNGRIGIEQ